VNERQLGKRWITLIDDLGTIEKPSFTPWVEGEDGNFRRVASIPEGMAVAEAERIFVANGGRLGGPARASFHSQWNANQD
jgi:hypothetical protein